MSQYDNSTLKDRSMFKSFARPRFRPALNIGCMLDLPTGKFELGSRGESILNGGLGSFTGIAARPNMFKTAIAVYMISRVRKAFQHSHSLAYDTEGTLHPVQRFQMVARGDEYLESLDYENDPQFSFTDLSAYPGGEQFFKTFRDAVETKTKAEKEYMRTTPFVDPHGKELQALYPTTGMIDSFTRLRISSVDKNYEKNLVGDSALNTDAMATGKAKNQLLNQVPGICANTGTYFIMTAHVGNIINMEMYPTDKRSLRHQKKDTTILGVSPGFYALPNNLWDITDARPLHNRDKLPLYPVRGRDYKPGDPDLMTVTMINLRGKGGISGMPITLVVSQSEGLLPSLSELHNCISNDYFGMEGSNVNFSMALCPDEKMTRPSVREKLDGSAKLRRAVQLTSEILQLYQLHRDLAAEYRVEPKALYDELAAMGYDWDELLNTRSYWVFKEDEALHPQPYLSAMDLLRMWRHEYVPYWLSKESRAKLKLPGAKAKETGKAGDVVS